jgi:hypothetical protein
MRKSPRVRRRGQSSLQDKNIGSMILNQKEKSAETAHFSLGRMMPDACETIFSHFLFLWRLSCHQNITLNQ